MTSKRRPLNHTPSLFTPPLARASHSVPTPEQPHYKPPLFNSKSESRYSPTLGTAPKSGNTLKPYFFERSKSVASDSSDEKNKNVSSINNFGSQISSFVSLSSQLSLHVAQTMVADLMSSPMVPLTNSSMDPNVILDSLLNDIKENLKKGESVQVSLPDTKVSNITLSNGALTGLQNVGRWGEADIVTR